MWVDKDERPSLLASSSAIVLPRKLRIQRAAGGMLRVSATDERIDERARGAHVVRLSLERPQLEWAQRRRRVVW